MISGIVFTFLIGWMVGVATLIVFLLWVTKDDTGNSDADREQLEYIDYYNKSKKGGTKDGEKAERPEDH